MKATAALATLVTNATGRSRVAQNDKETPTTKKNDKAVDKKKTDSKVEKKGRREEASKGSKAGDKAEVQQQEEAPEVAESRQQFTVIAVDDLQASATGE